MSDPQLNGQKSTGLVGARAISGESLGNMYENENILSLRDSLQIVRRRALVILLVALLPVALVVGYDLIQTPVYEASIKVLIGQEGTDAPSALNNELQGLEELTPTMSTALGTRPVAEGVIQRLNLDISPGDFLDNLNVEQIEGTQFITVSYRDSNPERARLIANTVGYEFSDQISEVSPGTSAITAMVWETATTPDSSVSPNPIRDGFLALAMGIVLGVWLALLLEYLDDNWRSPDESERVSGVPTLAVVPKFKVRRKPNKIEERQ